MRYTKLFGKTLKQAPADENSVNAQLLTRGGFVQKVAAGIYDYLPLGKRVLTKIERIIREEMDAVGGQEVTMPIMHPLELWQTTGRDETAGSVLYRTKGHGDKDFVLGMSHEETVTPLAGSYIQSYKDLPLALYQIQWKFRNEPRAKSGVLRGREFGMKDMYSFHTSDEDLDAYYEQVKEAYLRVYERCGLAAYVVEASGGVFSDKLSHEFAVKTPAGEDTIIVCAQCKHAQNVEVAEADMDKPHDPKEKEADMKEVSAKRDVTVRANAAFHNVPEWKILKNVIYKAGDGFVGVSVRGDLDVSDEKLARHLQEAHLRPATSEELGELGLVQGFISPVGNDLVPFIGDHSIEDVKNFVTGANKPDTDLVNVNVGRDFTVREFAGLASVTENFACRKCGGKLTGEKAIEAGNIFKLGTRYTKDFGVSYLDEKGERKMPVMGCYGIGTTRLVGTIVEAHHDDNGIIWPREVAPYLVHLVSLGNDADVLQSAEDLYVRLLESGCEVLFDDRDETAGVKFADADLIGLPIRLLVSKKTLEKKSAELKLRAEKNSEMIELNDVVRRVSS